MSIFDIFRISKIKAENEYLKKTMQDLGVKDIQSAQEMERSIRSRIDEDNRVAAQLSNRIQELQTKRETSEQEFNSRQQELSNQIQSSEKQVKTNRNKVSRMKDIYKRIEYAIDTYMQMEPSLEHCKLDRELTTEIDELVPSVILKLHCMDIKELRKAYRENDKQINKLLELYSGRYTTKANKSIYQLMVIALRSELQNVLCSLKYEKLDKAIEDVKNITAKYLQIAGEGNQSIAGTLTKFIGEIEYLFINAVKIEYNYYVKKEQAKQEQLAIREQMKLEAEERKALEAERKKIENEEQKYHTEIAKVEEMLNSAAEDEIEKLKAKLLELQGQLSDVTIKKEEITNLQNGKAGTVYIISNLGSFGENVFKIGMTRRLQPQDRVNELGNASVPFKFDVHAFIFSEDAVALENKIHTILKNKRVNKVNVRKEFFNIGLDELEQLVDELEPTAEFNRTMAAEEYRQSISTSEVYTSDYIEDEDSLAEDD